MIAKELQQLSDEVEELIRKGGPDEQTFESLALRIHTAQCAQLDAVAHLSRLQGKEPGELKHSSEIPAVPVAAFKRYDLFAGHSPLKTFRSSGTTGSATSCAHYSGTGLELMDAAIEVNARRMLFPDGRCTRILVLAPSPQVAPAMIMAYGMSRLIELFGLPGSRFVYEPKSPSPAPVVEALSEAAAQNIPVTLIGASFGLVHLLDYMAARGLRLTLPEGSRTMDAGGFKGRSREISPEAMRATISERLGVDPPAVINLLGMTELPSQLYDDDLAAYHERRPPLHGKRVPPWMRASVLDPQDLNPCAPGEPGLLRYIDLANVERPLAILSDDLGMCAEDGGITVLGRADRSNLRGCSLSLEEWGAALREKESL